MVIVVESKFSGITETLWLVHIVDRRAVSENKDKQMGETNAKIGKGVPTRGQRERSNPDGTIFGVIPF